MGNDVHLPAVGILVEFLHTPAQHFLFNLGASCFSIHSCSTGSILVGLRVGLSGWRRIER